MKEVELRLWSNIFVLLLKLRINFYVKTYLCVHRHIVPLCMYVIFDTVISSDCGVVRQPYNVPMYFVENSTDICKVFYFELQCMQ